MLTTVMQPAALSSSSTKSKQKFALKPSVVLTSSPTPKAAAPACEPLPPSLVPQPRSPGGTFASSPPISILPVPMKNVSLSSAVAGPVPVNSSLTNDALSTPIHLRKAAASTTASGSSGLASPTKYAGSKFSSSPSPKSLPIPVFSLKGGKTSEDGPDEGLLSAASSLSTASPSIFSDVHLNRQTSLLSSSLPNISEHLPESSLPPSSNPFLSLRKDLSFPTVSGNSPLAAAASRRPEMMTSNTTTSGSRKSKAYDSSSPPTHAPMAKKMSPGRSRPARASAPASAAALPLPPALPIVSTTPNQAKSSARDAGGAASSHQHSRRRAKSSFQGQSNPKLSGSKKDNNGRPKTQPNQANASHNRPEKDISSASRSMDSAPSVDSPSSLAEISNHLKQLLNIVDGPKA